MKYIKVLSLPSYHPAISKFNDGKKIIFVNPDTNYFEKEQFEKSNEIIYSGNYDLVHIHFEYYLLSFYKFKNILNHFKKLNKPIIWTFHDRSNILVKDNSYKYEKLLFEYSDKIIAPTNLMKKWILKNFSKHKNSIDVIPFGYFISPEELKSIKLKFKKDFNLFTFLIGDFRESKEYINSIIDFLIITDLAKVKLQVIYRPSEINKIKNKKTLLKVNKCLQILKSNKRIKVIAKDQITDKKMAEFFFKSKTVILPYKWGTHSGQIELAKDTDTNIVVSNVGFYREQFSNIFEYEVVGRTKLQIRKSYQQALINSYYYVPKKINYLVRLSEWRAIVNKYYSIYCDLLKNIYND